MIKTEAPSPTAVFLWTTVAYAVLIGAASAASSGLLKALANAAAILFFMVMLVTWAFLPKLPHRLKGYWFAFSLYYLGLTASVIFNSAQIDLSDALKFFMAPAFFLFGVAFEKHRNDFLWLQLKYRQLYFLLVFLPLVVFALQLATGATSLGAGREVAMFANKNNAGLYAVTLLALFNVLSGRPITNIYVYLAAGLVFGTLGVLIAVLMALIVTVAKTRELRLLLVAALIVCVVYLAAPDLGVLNRVGPVVDTIKYLYEGRINLRTSTYADFVGLLNTTDLSFVFRLKHWTNLVDIFLRSSPSEYLFGYGIGSSVRVSDIGLVPHNDYLRYLFECGAVAFSGFLMVVAMVVYQCGRRWETVPLLTVGIYFFSENLVNNYLAMTIFYFCSGALVLRLGSKKCSTDSKNW